MLNIKQFLTQFDTLKDVAQNLDLNYNCIHFSIRRGYITHRFYNKFYKFYENQLTEQQLQNLRQLLIKG